MKRIILYCTAAWLLLQVAACSKDTFTSQPLTEVDPGIFEPKPFDVRNITDTYGHLQSYAFTGQWGPYNLHDPSIIQDGEWYYCFSTDVAYGQAIRPGIMVRRSRDLVEWEFRGWAYDGLPQQAVDYIKSQSQDHTPNEGIWAPYIMKVGNEYRLY